MRSSLKFLFSFLLVICGFGLAGCERERDSDYYNNGNYYYGSGSYPRYVSVEVYAYTSWSIDTYIGDAYVGSLEPGGSTTFSKSLYGGEKLRLSFVIHNPNGSYEVPLSFDDDYQNYHVNVYNDHVEHF